MKKIITTLIIILLFALTSGCAGLTPSQDNNPNDLKKSPCACDPLNKEFQTIGKG